MTKTLNAWVAKKKQKKHKIIVCHCVPETIKGILNTVIKIKKVFFVRRARGSLFKKICPKRTFPSDFVKLGSEILYLFLAEKMVGCFVCFVCCNFVRFWLTFLLIEAVIELRKLLLRKKVFDGRFGNCSTP